MEVIVKTDNDSLLEMFAVEPKRNCPHITEQFINHTEETLQQQKKKIFELPCLQCNNKTENWICLVCNQIHCSRYVNAHMVEHCLKEKHAIALSLVDLSFWCYACDSYITNFELDKLRLRFSNLKFSNADDLESLADELSLLDLGKKDKAAEAIARIKDQEQEKKEQKQDLKEEQKIQKEEKQKKEEKKNQEEEKIETDQKEKFSYEQLIEGLQNKKFQKIAFLTGAGISVASGIPDFRTPGTGLYSKLDQYNLEHPEQIFEIPFFMENPMPFYEVAQEFLMMGVNPVNAHYFQVLLQNRNQLLISLTQNIDGLELQAGLDEKYLIQAHGHFRTAHCIQCHKEIDIKILTDHIKQKEIMKCECGGLCKPDIVFFGESLPENFFKNVALLKKADLAFIMGTSLMVAPFNYFAETFLKNVPLVCINKFFLIDLQLYLKNVTILIKLVQKMFIFKRGY